MYIQSAGGNSCMKHQSCSHQQQE